MGICRTQHSDFAEKINYPGTSIDLRRYGHRQIPGPASRECRFEENSVNLKSPSAAFSNP